MQRMSCTPCTARCTAAASSPAALSAAWRALRATSQPWCTMLSIQVCSAEAVHDRACSIAAMVHDGEEPGTSPQQLRVTEHRAFIAAGCTVLSI